MTSQLEPGQVIAARYQLLRPLRPGTVDATAPWLAHDLASSRDVVLKFNADQHGAEQGEVAARLARLAHPALLQPLRDADDAAADFAIYPHLAGGESGRLRGRPWPFIVRRLLPVIDALSHLHAAGVAHGDVKSANVLLDADGLAHLADFGSAQLLGSAARAPGSPYAMSPERHAGAPVSVADDTYAVGVLLYELISGHPPFYPELTPERVRAEAPAPLTGRPAPPEELQALVAQCLAKAPAERPATLREVHARLEAALESAAMTELAPAASAPALQPPPDAVAIRAQWRRTTGDPQSLDGVRREGFRRGLLASALVVGLAAAAFTFFMLPDIVAQRTARAVTPATVSPSAASTAPAATTRPEQSLEELAELKRRAEELRAPLLERVTQLEQTDAARWGTDGLAAAKARLMAGDASMDAREFAAAIEHFEAVASGLAALERQRTDVLKQLLAEAADAFDAGRSADATARFAAALRIDAANATARMGLARAKVLDEVLRETALGARAEQQGEAGNAAAAYQRALALDPAARTAREGLARLQARAAGDAFAAAMAEAQAAIARQDYAAARTALQRAGSLRPGAAEVAAGLQQVQLANETRQLAQVLERARAAEREERWSDAVAAYREALKTDSTLREAQEGVERSEPRAMLGAQLQAYIDRPERLFSPQGRDAARSALAQAASAGAAGPRLEGQVARVTDLLRQAETPVRVALASDNVTDVQVYRVGKLGLFERRDLELMPGRYTVVGTRQGYRDVRKEINLLPGAAPPTVMIRCEEPI
jgi:eukaryotic-like serine/threonine-protein kinase